MNVLPTWIVEPNLWLHEVGASALPVSCDFT